MGPMKKAETHPALCEIQNCGVLAVGRCGDCRLAMCDSHRGTYSISYGTVIHSGRCNNCTTIWFGKEAAKKQAAEESARASVRADERLVKNEARHELRSHKIPTVDVYRFTGWKRTSLLFGKELRTYELVGEGWLIGSFEWERGGAGGSNETWTSRESTVLLDNDHDSLAWVEKDDGSPGYVLRKGKLQASLSLLAKAVREIISK